MLGTNNTVEVSAWTPSSREGESGSPAPKGTDEEPLVVNVIYTSHSGTLAALRVAMRLSADLFRRIRIYLPYVVPWTLPLARQAVPPGYLEDCIHRLTCESPTAFSVQVQLCRELREGLRHSLRPHSLVVMGGKKSWWPREEVRLARGLRKAGHHVVFVPLAGKQ